MGNGFLRCGADGDLRCPPSVGNDGPWMELPERYHAAKVKT